MAREVERSGWTTWSVRAVSRRLEIVHIAAGDIMTADIMRMCRSRVSTAQIQLQLRHRHLAVVRLDGHAQMSCFDMYKLLYCICMSTCLKLLMTLQTVIDYSTAYQAS